MAAVASVGPNLDTDRIVAEFAHHAASDPLCCLSRIDRVTYETSDDGAPLVIPRNIDARLTASPRNPIVT